MNKRLLMAGLVIGCLMVSGGCSKDDKEQQPTKPPVHTNSPTQTKAPDGTDEPEDKVERPSGPKIFTVEQKDIYEEYEGYTIKKMYKSMSSGVSLNIRKGPDETFEKIDVIEMEAITNVIGQCEETGWYMISYSGGVGFVSNDFLTQEVDKGNLILGDECPYYLFTKVEYNGQTGWFYRAEVGWQCENYEQVKQEIIDEGYSVEHFPVYVGNWRDVGDVMWIGFTKK